MSNIIKKRTPYIRKANDLVMAMYSSDVLQEKILLAIIRQAQYKEEWREDEGITVTISLSELRRDFGIKRPKLETLRAATDIIRHKEVKLLWNGEYKDYNPFPSVEYDKKTLKFYIIPIVKRYVQELNKNFTQYHIENIKPLKSSYSIRIYELIKMNAYKGRFKITIEELKTLFGIEDKYKNYKDLRVRVIEPAKSELFKHCDVYFEYREIKAGNKVDELEFIIKKQNKNYSMLEIETPFSDSRGAVTESKDCWFEDYIAATDELKQKSDLINFVENCRNLDYLPMLEKIKLTKLDSASELEFGNKILFREYMSTLH